MESAQNKMNNSSCCSNNGGMVRGRLDNSTNGSTKNQGDMREIDNRGDLRDVTDKGGNMNRNNMTNS